MSIFSDTKMVVGRGHLNALQEMKRIRLDGELFDSHEEKPSLADIQALDEDAASTDKAPLSSAICTLFFV